VSDDAGWNAGLFGARGQGGDHVVGLPALELDIGVAEGLDQRAEVWELLAQQVGRRLARPLVGLEDLLAVHRAGIPGDRDAARLVVAEQLEQHAGEAVERVCMEAVAGGDVLGQGVVGAVSEVVAVNQEELARARGRIVQIQLRSTQILRRHRLRV
jgi:hypothetical protein